VIYDPPIYESGGEGMGERSGEEGDELASLFPHFAAESSN